MFIFLLVNVIHCLRIKEVYELDPNFKLSQGPIFAKGWLKFTNYTLGVSTKPKEFVKNLYFYDQFRNTTPLDTSKADKVGYINIPDDEHFFFILSEGGVNIISSRKVKYYKS